MDAFDQGYALIVGVGADLPNTVNDAIGLADILNDPTRCAYPPAQVHLLTGENARREHILAALDTLSLSTTSQSTLIVYFSGHGYQVTAPTGEFYYLMPFGYDINRLYQTAISGAEFTERLSALPAQKLLVLLDCCHAGGVGEAKAPGLQMAKSPLPSEAQRLLTRGSGRVLIASCQEDETSFGGKPYSAFTLALIEALCGVGVTTQDGHVHVADLARHTREAVPERTGGRQHPILHFEQADDFVLAYYAAGDVQPKGLPFAGEPEIEPEPGAWHDLDQRGQIVPGPQIGVAGDVREPMERQSGDRIVISGDISGKVAVGEKITQIDKIDAQTVAIGQEITQTVDATRSAADEIPVKGTPEREHLAKLRQILATRFDEEELRTLCFDLGINYDDLPGQGNANKARELIAYLDRHDRISELVSIGKQLRPDVAW